MSKESNSSESLRKAFAEPSLTVYGDFHELTRTVGMNGTMDSGQGSVKTKP